jgi:uncharacterized membrane protein
VASLFVLVITAVVLRIAGWLGVTPLTSWGAVGRTSSSVMLLFTGSSHFSSMKDDFVAMLPEPVPKDVRIIYLTGLTEIAGAIGLLIPNTRRAAGMALVVQLAAMFPANVNAALQGIPLRGKPPTALWLRAPMQLLYIAVIWLTAISGPPNAAKSKRIRFRR